MKLAECPSGILKAKVLKGNLGLKATGGDRKCWSCGGHSWGGLVRGADGTHQLKEKKTKMNLNHNQRKLRGPRCALPLSPSPWRRTSANGERTVVRPSTWRLPPRRLPGARLGPCAGWLARWEARSGAPRPALAAWPPRQPPPHTSAQEPAGT